MRVISPKSVRARSTGRRLAILSAVALLVALTPTRGDAEHPSLSSSQELFRRYCVPCHGESGEGGGMGPSFVEKKSIELADSDLFQVISRGRIEQGMPGFGRALKPPQIENLVAFVRALQGVDFEGGGAMSGTTATLPKALLELIVRGRDLFVGRARCLDCHSIFDEGGIVAPDLTTIAKRMGPVRIRESILNPSSEIAPGFGAKEIVFQDGREIRGWYRDETPETIQIFDPVEQLWTTYFKRELQSVRETPESLMPADLLDPLSRRERRDLMAFLASLR